MAADPAAFGGDHDLNEWRLDGKRLSADLSGAITGGEFEGTIEGASTLTLTVRDTQRKLLRCQLLQGDALRLDAAGLQWELAAISKQGDDLTLTFEDLRVAKYRRQTKPRKAARGKVTRAEFIKSLVDEVKRPKTIFVCPELHKKQPIEKQRDHKSKAEKDDDRDPGIADGTELAFRNAPATPSQIRLAERTLDIVASHDAPGVVFLATAMININETAFRNLPSSSDGKSRGAMQLLNSIAADNGVDNMDVEEVINFWLLHGSAIDTGAIEYARQNPGISPAQIARDVWGGQGFALSTWTKWADEARALVDAYGGAGGLGSTITDQKKYEYSRGKPGGPKGESTWAASKRLADEVGWRRFIVRNRFYYMAEEDLIRSRPRMVISEQADGVDWIDFDLDSGKKAAEATVTCRAKLWQAPPGSTVQIKRTGPANGRWLVSTVRRGLFSTATTIELRRARALLREKPEPAPETINRTVGGRIGGIAGTSGQAAAMVEWARSVVGTVEGDARYQRWQREIGLYDPWCSFFIAYGLKVVCGITVPPGFAHSSSWLSWSEGERINAPDRQPGDLIVYEWGQGSSAGTDHVALYVGNGQTIGGNEGNPSAVRVNSDRIGNAVGVVRPHYGAR